MATNLTDTAEKYLEALADELTISDSRYDQAHESYRSIGNWLNRDDSGVRKYRPAIYVQGSFALGTVIKPLTDAEEYDVDSVCQLDGLNTANLSQFQLKRLVGAEIEAYRVAKKMLKPLHESRRCWTLNYADGAQFHMDIVPALPDGQNLRVLLESRHLDARWAATSIVITDNEALNYQAITGDWPRSNPKGYLQWFRSRMAGPLERRKKVLAESMRASVEQIPDYRVRTPLQSAIMILKRHRDIMFNGDETNCCPISIIITTLAGHAYQSEEKIGDALLSILSRMQNFIENDGRKHIIRNPSNPLENFADKWEEFPDRAAAFFRWLRQAQSDFTQAAAQYQREKITESLGPRIGTELAKRAQNRSAGTGSSSLLKPAAAAAVGAASAPAFGNEPRVPTKPQGFA